MSQHMLSKRWSLWGGLTLAGIALLRLAPLGELALTDSTESRYGIVAWQMFRSGDWVTPRVYVRTCMPRSSDWSALKQHIQGDMVPYWGKPPLEFWLTSFSYRVFGVSEWSARVPSFLLCLAIVAATVGFAGRFWGGRVAMLAGIVLGSSVLFLVLSGVCILDIPLTAATSGAMMAFALFADGPRRRRAWGLAFFLALAMGALAKGPIALVLVGVAVGIWLLVVGRWRLLVELPWLFGLLVFFAVAAPWYVLAERATPGFLRYFFINEHFGRYLRSEYGDLYGHGRKHYYGAAWAWLAGSFFPWTILAAIALGRLFRGSRPWQMLRAEPRLAYVLIWGLVPALFFTLARHVLLTYVLPGLPGLAIATAVGLDRWMDSDRAAVLLRMLKWHLVAIGLIALVGAVVAVWYYGASPYLTAVVTMAVLGWLVWAATRRFGPAALVGVMGLTMAAIFTAAAFLVGPAIDDQCSAKVILGRLFQENPAAKDRTIVVPLSDTTYSAPFYLETVFHGRFKPCQVRDAAVVGELLDGRGGEVFLFEKRDWNKFKKENPELAARLLPIVETAYWIAGEGKHQP
jgi:4-amino-4-deoxy-L-arabinose transferase-like glycosyltransferase